MEYIERKMFEGKRKRRGKRTKSLKKLWKLKKEMDKHFPSINQTKKRKRCWRIDGANGLNVHIRPSPLDVNGHQTVLSRILRRGNGGRYRPWGIFGRISAVTLVLLQFPVGQVHHVVQAGVFRETGTVGAVVARLKIITIVATGESANMLNLFL